MKKNSKNTVDSQQMKKTIVDPHQKSFIKCEKCSKNFKTQEMFAKHYFTTHLNQEYYECEKCGQIFDGQSELTKHIINHSPIKPIMK